MGLTAWFSEPTQAPNVLFPFLHLTGDVAGVQQQLEVVERPGVNGFGVYRTGLRGETFSMDSACDYGTRAAALQAYAGYVSRVGTRLRLFKYGGQSLGDVVVMRVVMKPLKNASAANGGINLTDGSSGVVLQCSWQLRGV